MDASQNFIQAGALVFVPADARGSDGSLAWFGGPTLGTVVEVDAEDGDALVRAPMADLDGWPSTATIEQFVACGDLTPAL